MRERKENFKRVIGVDDIEQYDKPTNAFKVISNIDAVLKNIGEGESIIDNTNNRILIKKDGKYFKQVVTNNNITLEEV